MFFYAASMLFFFAFERIKNKIVCRFLHTGVKQLMYKPEWHREHCARFNFIPFLNDYVFL